MTERSGRREIAERGFKVLLFLYMGLGSCSLTYGKAVITPVMWAAFLLGGLVCLTRLVHWKRFVHMPLLLWAALLWVSYGLSLGANLRYADKNGLVYYILWTFYFFVLYAQGTDRTEEETTAGFRRLSLFFLGWTTVLVLVSLGMLVTGYERHYRDPANAGYEVAAGFFSGRLWGAFQDPNQGSVMCCAALAVCLYWLAGSEERRGWALLTVDGALLLVYIALSDSRTGMVCLGLLCALGALGLWKGKKRLWRAALLLVAAAVCGGLMIKLLQGVYNAAAAGHAAPVVDRGYSLAGDVSNRRLAIWEDGLRIGLSRPFTGVSFTGAVPYAREYMPEAYILTNGLWVFNTFDSELVNLFAAQGFPGLLLALGWFLMAVRRLVRRLSAGAGDRELFLLTAVCGVFVASALFQGTMFYQTSPNTFLFWSAFGALMRLTSRDDRGKGGDPDEIGTL